jgi:small basic protein
VSHSVLLGLVLGSLTAEARINFRNSVLSQSLVFNKTVAIAIRFLSLIS